MITWLLDVDGVINARRPAWKEMPRSAAVTTSEGETFTLRWAPSLMRFIRTYAIADVVVDVVWCTTWCPDADRLESLWRLPPLRRAFDHGGYTGDAKLEAARNVLARGDRLIWTDDTEVPLSGPTFEGLSAGGESLLIRPDGRRGLTPEHMDLIAKFVEEES